MSSLASPSSTGTHYGNSSIVAPLTNCGPCVALYIWPEITTWNESDPSIPALRIVQSFIDPNQNTTSTSVSCNSTAISAYPSAGYQSYSLNDACELVGAYATGVSYGSSGYPDIISYATVYVLSLTERVLLTEPANNLSQVLCLSTHSESFN